MKRTDLHHWRKCCDALGWQSHGVDEWHQRLISAYNEPQRAYHTLQHLEECLLFLDQCRCPSSPMVEMVLWFHDAVYDPKAGDNEEQSAQLAIDAMEPSGVPPTVVASIARLILVTKSHQPGDDIHAQCLSDIDLAIFGQPPERFAEYERQIRQEYAWVAEDVYRAKRGEILSAFLQQPNLYRTAHFQHLLETSARANLTRLITSLR